MRPIADLDTARAFLGPWRLMSVDGMEWDVSDTEKKCAAFGSPGSSGDVLAASSKIRVVTVSEYGSHAAVLILYVNRAGCAWRYLPTDFPPWRTVYGYFAAWRDNGTLQRLHDR